MQLTVNLDSFWVGFVAGWVSVFVLAAVLAVLKRKK